MNTVTTYREVPKLWYTARLLPRLPLTASVHPLLHIVKTSPASPCRLNLFLSPRNPAMGGGQRPMAKQAEKGARGSISDDRDRRGTRGHRDRVEVPAGWKKMELGNIPGCGT